MKRPVVGPLLLALVIFFTILCCPVWYFTRFIAASKLTNAAYSSDTDRYKSIYLEDAAFQKSQYLPFFGSSTIGIFSRYHPSNYFTPDQLTPYLVGQSGLTGVLHVLNFSAVSGVLPHKKLVYMLDPSDFMNPNGISDEGFTKYYSPLNGYSFVFNQLISPTTKRKIAEQLLKYSIIKKDPLLVSQLQGIVHTDLRNQVQFWLHRPQAFFYWNLLEKQDLLQSFAVLDKQKPYKAQTVPRNLSVSELVNQAAAEGKDASDNNEFGFINDTYTKSIEPKKESDKGAWKPGNYLNSVEYDDLQATLDILQKEHAEPLFILIPRKGSWSDYIGFTKTYRDALNAKIRNQVTAAGFQVMDYTDHEYDNYFMRDTSHLGWTGWVFVDQDVYKFLHP